MKKNLLLSMVVVLAGSAVLYFVQHRDITDSIFAENQPSASAGKSGTAASLRTLGKTPVSANGQKSGVYAVLDSGASLDTAISAVIGPDGVLTDSQMISLVEIASSVCGEDLDPHAAMNSGTEADPTRAWAVARVVRLCEGFDRSKYKFGNQPSDLSRVLEESGEEAAVSMSMEDIRTAPDFSHLFSAGQVLLETGHFPIKQAIPDGAERYGMTELMSAWAHASTLVACKEAGGCGPNSLEVAAYCANVGCPAGSTMQQALSQELSANDYRVVLAFYGWIIRQRQG